MSLCRKNIWVLPFGWKFLHGSRDVVKNSNRPFSIELRNFSPNGLGKCAIWIHGEKYLNIAIWFRISPPPVPQIYRKLNPTLLHWATAFFLNGLKKGFLFYIVKHIRLKMYKSYFVSFKSSSTFTQSNKQCMQLHVYICSIKSFFASLPLKWWTTF